MRFSVKFVGALHFELNWKKKNEEEFTGRSVYVHLRYNFLKVHSLQENVIHNLLPIIYFSKRFNVPERCTYNLQELLYCVISQLKRRIYFKRILYWKSFFVLVACCVLDFCLSVHHQLRKII